MSALAAETKEARLKERDRVHKHYRAVTAKRHLEIRDRIPAAAAFADWLATNPNSDDRADAVTLLQVPLLELDGMADPLWDEPPSTYQALRDATLYNKPAKSTNSAKKEPRTMITISINIADPSDAARIPALLASLAQFGAAVPVTPVALTPVPQVVATNQVVVATEAAAIAIQATESAKRPGRRAKAEIEAAAAPVVEAQPEPVAEPVVEAPVVEVQPEPEPVVEVQPVVEEPAVPAKEYKADDVLEALKAFARTPGGVPKIKEILAQFDATNLATIKPADYAAVIAALAVPA
jgi:hypothetical protein